MQQLQSIETSSIVILMKISLILLKTMNVCYALNYIDEEDFYNLVFHSSNSNDDIVNANRADTIINCR